MLSKKKQEKRCQIIAIVSMDYRYWLNKRANVLSLNSLSHSLPTPYNIEWQPEKQYKLKLCLQKMLINFNAYQFNQILRITIYQH